MSGVEKKLQQIKSYSMSFLFRLSLIVPKKKNGGPRWSRVEGYEEIVNNICKVWQQYWKTNILCES